MYFYENSEGLFQVGEHIVSPGNHAMRVYNNKTVVALEGVDTGNLLLDPIEIVYLQKEDDSYYVDFDELLLAIKGFFSSGEASAPFQSDLITYHKTITDNTFAESIENLPGKFLPRVAEFKGVDDNIDLGLRNFGTTNTIIIKANRKNTGTFYINYTSGNNIYSVSTTQLIYKVSGTSYVFLSADGLPDFINQDAVLCFARSGDDVSLYIDGVFIVTKNNVGAGDSIFQYLGGSTLFFEGNIFELSIYERALTAQEILDDSNGIKPITPLLRMYPTGQGDYEYDLSGSNNHGTWSGTGDRYTYDLEGSLYANQNGYSLWQHATLEDIQVPFDLEGNENGYGVERVINGGFDTDSDWVKGTGWTISEGKANAVATTALLRQLGILTLNKLYEVTFTLVDYVGGSVKIICGDTGVGTIRSANGTYTENIISSGGTGVVLYIAGHSSFTGKVDNVSVKEIFIPAGYTKTRNVVAGGDKWNMADAKVDFEAEAPILQCDTAGVAYIDSSVAYGLVFDGIINNSNVKLDIYIISEDTNIFPNAEGYLLRIEGNKEVKLYETRTGGVAITVMRTTAGYLTNSTDYRILMWRNETLDQYVTGNIGTFALYIQGKNKPITTVEYATPDTDYMELVDGTLPVELGLILRQTTIIQHLIILQ